MAARALRGGRPAGAPVSSARAGGRAIARRSGRRAVAAVAPQPPLVERPPLAQSQTAESQIARSRVVAMQRSRILAATVSAVDELGYSNVSVGDIVTRSRVSRRTFYELFANREQCVVAVLSDALERMELELHHAGVARLAWRERMRIGLWTILSFFEREPALARVCVVSALGGDPQGVALRDEVLARLAQAVGEGRLRGAHVDGCTRVTAEGVVGAAVAIVYARLREERLDSLTDLLGELMGIVVLPYLGSGAARRERSRPLPPPIRTHGDPAAPLAPAGDPLHGVRMRLTYRTACVLEGLQEHPGANNRQLAELAGIADQGQVSKLLRRLERLGLLENRGLGHAQGEPNAWTLTSKGALVAEGVRMHTPTPREASA